MSGQVTEDIYRLKTIVEADNVEKLKRDIDKAEEALRKHIATLGTSDVAVLKSNSAVMAQVSALRALDDQLKATQSSLSSSGQKFLNFGRMIDDLQYVPQQGLRPIINNVMEMAPVLGLAMIAVQGLISNWEALSKHFGMGHTKTEAEAMEELGKKTSRTADETARLNQYKRDQAQIQAATSIPAEAEQSQGKAFDEAVGSLGGSEKIRQGVRANLVKDGLDGLSTHVEGDSFEKYRDAKAKLAGHAPGTPMHGLLMGDMAKARDANGTALDVQVDKLMGKARGTPDGLKQLLNVVRDNAGAFPKDALSKLMDAAPGSIAGAKAGKEYEAREAAMNKGGDADVAERERKNKHYQSLMEEAGRHQDNLAEKERKTSLGWASATDGIGADAIKGGASAIKHTADETKRGVADAKGSGIGDLLREQFEAIIKRGGSIAGAAEDFRRVGGTKLGGNVADELIRDASGDAQRSAMRDFVNEKPKHSETIGGGVDLAHQIQAGVNNGGDKELRELQRANLLLGQILTASKSPSTAIAVLK